LASDQALASGAIGADGQPELLVRLHGGASTGLSRPPLFCVHPVSGSAYAYGGLARLMPASQPVYGFQAPGFDNDRAPVAFLPRLADEYTAILRSFAGTRPPALLGWSLGGLLAFEIAKRLHAAGDDVAALILVDAPLPHVAALPPEREMLLRFVNDMTGTSEAEAAPDVRALIGGWPDHIDPRRAFPLIEAARVLPAEMDAVLLAEQYAVFRALLEGFNSIEVTGTWQGEALHVLADTSPRREMDWSGALPGVREMTVHGTHYSIWAGRSLVAMSELVRAALDARQLR
jgi:thioesterase domain-containing protein